MTHAPLPYRSLPRFQSFRTISALMVREMSSTYGRSPGGYIWAVLEPVAMIAVMSVAFSLIVRTPSLGTSFLLFYATGLLPFGMYNTLTAKLGRALSFSKALLAYPRVTWVDALLARFFLNLLTQITVICIVIAGILTFSDTRAVIRIEPILISLSMVATIGAGVGVMNCLLMGLYPVWKHVWGIVTRPMFIASGVFFLYEDMPPVAQDILWWNPVLHAVGEMRRGFYSTYEADYVSLAYGYGSGGVLLLLGLIFLQRHYKRILES